MTIHFIKMQACGNDFVFFKQEDLTRSLTTQDIQKIADRRFGIGCDQVFILDSNPHTGNEVFIFNADGSIAKACGNGMRCAALLLNQVQSSFKTASGILKTWKIDDNSFAVDMGEPRFEWNQIPLAFACDPSALLFPHSTLPAGIAVNVGNPHVVFFLENIENIDLGKIGPRIENDPLFPDKTNVELVKIISPTHLRVRIWERGASITPACGSGACAAAIAAIHKNLIPRSTINVEMDGGILQIEWTNDHKIIQSGPAHYCFTGHFPLV